MDIIEYDRRQGTSRFAFKLCISGISQFIVKNLKTNEENSVIREINLPETYNSPVEKGQILGNITYYLNNKIIGENKIIALEQADKLPDKKTVFSKIL